MPTNDILCIIDTLQYTPKESTFPKTTTGDYLQKAIRDTLAIIQDPPKTIPFLSYGDGTKYGINHIVHILQQSKDQTCLNILPFPPIIPQSQT